MRDHEIEAAWHGLASCEQCSIRDLVLFADLKSEDFGIIHLPIDDIRLSSGAALYQAGQAAGLEATLADAYEHTAVALSPAKVCRVPRDVVTRLTPKLHRQLMKKWHDAVQRSHECTRELSTGSARQRLARLFRLLAPETAGECRLFGREDLGALLGITTETASRVVAEFKRSAVVTETSPNLFRRDLAAHRHGGALLCMGGQSLGAAGPWPH
jgi:CRP/FNR family transcriptional regulator